LDLTVFFEKKMLFSNEQGGGLSRRSASFIAQNGSVMAGIREAILRIIRSAVGAITFSDIRIRSSFYETPLHSHFALALGR
jgi:hypothetical protein